MARKKKHPEHVNHERWLISYADFVTLLFAFFTSMYAISTVDAKKAGQMVFSTRAAFNMDFFPTANATLGGTDRSPDPLDPSSVKIVQSDKINPNNANARNGRIAQLDGVAKQIEIALNASALKSSVKVKRVGGNLIISLADAAFFESGRAGIRPSSVAAFHKIAAALVSTKQALRIEGHTDDQPVGRGPFHSNMELSAARAASVVTYLSQEFTYAPELMSIAGYASNRPTASNDTPEGRAQNRRVDIVLMAPEAPQDVPPAVRAMQEAAHTAFPTEAAAPTSASASASAPTPAPPGTPAVVPSSEKPKGLESAPAHEPAHGEAHDAPHSEEHH